MIRQHAIVWIIVLAYACVNDFLEGDYDAHSFHLNVTYWLANLGTFYFFYIVVWHKLFPKRNKILVALAIVVGYFLFSGLRMLLEEIILKAITGYGNYRNPFSLFYIKDNALRPLLLFALATFFWSIKKQREESAIKASLEREKYTAEMSFLRSQINPHFLFNTLGFIHSKAYQYDESLSEMIEELSFILRKSIDSAYHEDHAIKDELEIIEKLHGIFSKRFPNQCHFILKNAIGNPEAQIEPMILLTIVENIFKHGDLRDKNAPANVQIKEDNGAFELKAFNRIMPGKPHLGTGIGLDNVQRRLDLIYPGRYTFDITRENNYFEVYLKIEL